MSRHGFASVSRVFHVGTVQAMLPCMNAEPTRTENEMITDWTERNYDDLNHNINKLNRGESIATCFCHNLTKLVEVFGGRDWWRRGTLRRGVTRCRLAAAF
jgi:hypothetical protein